MGMVATMEVLKGEVAMAAGKKVEAKAAELMVVAALAEAQVAVQVAVLWEAAEEDCGAAGGLEAVEGAVVVTVDHGSCTRAARRASSSEIDPPAGLSRTVRCSRRRTVPQTAPRSPVPPSLRIGTPHRSSCLQTSRPPTPRTETAMPGIQPRLLGCTPRPNPQACHLVLGQTPMR